MHGASIFDPSSGAERDWLTNMALDGSHWVQARPAARPVHGTTDGATYIMHWVKFMTSLPHFADTYKRSRVSTQ